MKENETTNIFTMGHLAYITLLIKKIRILV